MIAATTILSLGLQLPLRSPAAAAVASSTAVTSSVTITSSATSTPKLHDSNIAASAGIALFYADEARVDDATVSCWLDPEDSGRLICARDVDLWDDSSSADDSY